MIKTNLKRLGYALNGLLNAIKTDTNYRLQFFGIPLILGIFIYFIQPISQTELIFLGLAYSLVLITELQNSSFENALNRLHPKYHESIGKSKDMAAGSVLIAGLFLLFVMFIIVVI